MEGVVNFMKSFHRFQSNVDPLYQKPTGNAPQMLLLCNFETNRGKTKKLPLICFFEVRNKISKKKTVSPLNSFLREFLKNLSDQKFLKFIGEFEKKNLSDLLKY